MKLILKNFGPIDTCELDLSKQFTLIVGQNNIGKSYAISLLYALIKTFNRFRRHHMYYPWLNEVEEPDGSKISALAESVSARLSQPTNGDGLDITSEIVEIFRSQLELTVVAAFQQSLYGTFSEIGNLQNRLTKAPLEIRLEDENFVFSMGVKDNKLAILELKLGHDYVAKKVKQNRTVKDSEYKSIIYFPEGKVDNFEVNVTTVLFYLHQRLITDVCGAIYDLHYLPASRSGLYQSLSAFGQIVAELAKNRSLLRQKIELPGISEPLSDYFLKLSDIRTPSPDESGKAFREIADEMEKDILKGKVEIESKTKKILFKPDGVSLSLDLSTTSSMVSEITPIVTYLRYVLPRLASTVKRLPKIQEQWTQLMFIEEPEAHLHPQIQTKLVELLVKLSATTPTKIILTSHSNYIFNKCSNLIMGEKLDPSRFSAILFNRSPTGSKTVNLKISAFGIADQNFVDVGEELYDEKMALIESKNQK